MSFIDFRLSDEVSAGFQGGPEWSTREVPLRSGVSLFHPRWSMPRCRFVADYTLLGDAGREEVMGAFIVAMGRTHSFRFQDPNDFQVERSQFGVGDGSSTPLQLVKVYEFGPTASFARKIVLPIVSSVAVWEGDTPKVVTVDPLSGLVTPATPWANAALLYWSGEFDNEVQFGADYYPFTRVSTEVTQCTIDLVEKKRP